MAPLPEDSAGIALSEPLSDDEYRQLADLLERHPDKKFYVSQLDSSTGTQITDLEFLRFFPNLRVLSLRLPWLQTLDGIERLRHVEKLSIFKSSRRMSAGPLAALTHLDYLSLDGQYSDRNALRRLTALTNFSMGFAGKVPDLSFLPPNLTRFSMSQGSVTDINALAELSQLQTLELHKVQSLADLSPLARATGLRSLYLAYLNKVSELFDMSALTQLTELTVSMLTHLRDLRPVLTAPKLTSLSVYGLPGLEPGSWHETCTGWLAQGKPPFWA